MRMIENEPPKSVELKDIALKRVCDEYSSDKVACKDNSKAQPTYERSGGLRILCHFQNL